MGLAGSAFASRWGAAATWGFAGGSLFGAANLALLALLVRAVLRVTGPQRRRALLLAGAKFPVLYALGYVLLFTLHVQPVAFLAGFTGSLVALVATALLTGANGWMHTETHDRGHADSG